MYGDIDKENDKKITGTLNYDVTFNCQFKFNQEGYDQCIKDGKSESTCKEENSGSNTCKKDIYTSLGIFTKTPKIVEIWQRLVDGQMGVFKRFFPKVGIGSPLEDIKQIPASTQIKYQSSDGEAKAGVTGKGGSEAQIYFPFVGSLQEYFLKGIQKALRPQDLNAYTLAGEPSPGPETAQNIEVKSISCPGPKNLSAPPEASTNSCKAPSACRSVADSDIPSQYLALKENTQKRAFALAGMGGNLVDECFNYVVKRSLNAGINPVYSLAIWVQESAASNYDRFGCTTQDMGVNNKKIAADLDAQLTAFLRLPYRYPNEVAPQCFKDGCSIEAFSLVFQQGAKDVCSINSSAVKYADKTRNTAKAIAPNCDFPIYPTEMTACR